MERWRSRKRNIFFEGNEKSKQQKPHFGSGSMTSLGFLSSLENHKTEKTEENEEINFIRKAGRVIGAAKPQEGQEGKSGFRIRL